MSRSVTVNRMFVASATVTAIFMTSALNADVLNKEELLAGVEEVREELRSGFQVHFSFVKETGTDEMVEGDHRAVSIEGQKFRTDRTYHGIDVFYGGSHDGEHSWSYQQASGSLTYQAGSSFDDRIDTEATGFFDLMMWHPCEEIRKDGLLPHDLAHILSSPNSVVRPETEEVNGHETHVVDVYSWSGNGPLKTIWIAVDYGFLPVYQRNYADSGNGEYIPHVAFEIEDAAEIAEGVWIPVEGTRETMAPVSAASLYRMKVDKTDNGVVEATTSPTIDEGFFDYSTQVPPGTLVVNKDTDEMFVVHGTDYRATGEAAFASLPKEIRDKFADRSVQAQRAWWIPPYDEPAWLAVTAVAGVLTIAAMRKFGG